MNKHTRGFTLLEALVAISMVAVATGAPLYGASRALITANISKDRLTASYLAQEGIEHVRKVRDNAYLAVYADPYDKLGQAWTGLPTSFTAAPVYTDCDSPSEFCTIDTTTNQVVRRSANDIPVLNLHTASQRYTYTTGSEYTPTLFKRWVQITPITGREEVRVTSTVEWQYKDATYSVVLVDNLTSWK